MKITKQNTLKEIKDNFTKTYPGLKIEFYKEKHEDYKGSSIENQYDDSLTIADINPKRVGEISMTTSNTVKEVEQSFERLFGLHVQIFRRSNELWLQSSTTDDWTLEVQNRKGLHSIQS